MTRIDWPTIANAIAGPERTRRLVAALRKEEALARHFGDFDGADWLRQVADQAEATLRGSGAMVPHEHLTEEARARFNAVLFLDAASIGARVFRDVLGPIITGKPTRPTAPGQLLELKDALEQLRKGRLS